MNRSQRINFCLSFSFKLFSCRRFRELELLTFEAWMSSLLLFHICRRLLTHFSHKEGPTDDKAFSKPFQPKRPLTLPFGLHLIISQSFVTYQLYDAVQLNYVFLTEKVTKNYHLFRSKFWQFLQQVSNFYSWAKITSFWDLSNVPTLVCTGPGRRDEVGRLHKTRNELSFTGGNRWSYFFTILS